MKKLVLAALFVFGGLAANAQVERFHMINSVPGTMPGDIRCFVLGDNSLPTSCSHTATSNVYSAPYMGTADLYCFDPIWTTSPIPAVNVINYVRLIDFRTGEYYDYDLCGVTPTIVYVPFSNGTTTTWYHLYVGVSVGVPECSIQITP